MSTIVLPTAADVRKHFRSNPKAMASLSEAAQATVAEGPQVRGRIHPEARDLFNKGKKPSERYGEGQPKTVILNYRRVTKSGSRKAQVALPEPTIRELAIAHGGVQVGERGPLSNAAMEAAAEQYAANLG